jgi:hypothetical protein
LLPKVGISKFGTSPYRCDPEDVFCGKQEIISSFIPRRVNPVLHDSYACIEGG